VLSGQRSLLPFSGELLAQVMLSRGILELAVCDASEKLGAGQAVSAAGSALPAETMMPRPQKLAPRAGREITEPRCLLRLQGGRRPPALPAVQVVVLIMWAAVAPPARGIMRVKFGKGCPR
jgi:hypothetical protein